MKPKSDIVDDLRNYLDAAEGAKIEAESISKDLKSVQRAMVTALATINTAEHDLDEPLTQQMDVLAQMCSQMVDVLRAKANKKPQSEPEMRVVSNE